MEKKESEREINKKRRLMKLIHMKVKQRNGKIHKFVDTFV